MARIRREVGPDVRKEMAGILRRRVSPENQQEFTMEKRAKELASRGFNQAAIGGMMQISEHEAQKLVKHNVTGRRSKGGKPTLILDGDV